MPFNKQKFNVNKVIWELCDKYVLQLRNPLEYPVLEIKFSEACGRRPVIFCRYKKTLQTYYEHCLSVKQYRLLRGPEVICEDERLSAVLYSEFYFKFLSAAQFQDGGKGLFTEESLHPVFYITLWWFATTTNLRFANDQMMSMIVSGVTSCGKSTFVENLSNERSFQTALDGSTVGVYSHGFDKTILHYTDINLVSVMKNHHFTIFKQLSRANAVTVKKIGGSERVLPSFLLMSSNTSLWFTDEAIGELKNSIPFSVVPVLPKEDWLPPELTRESSPSTSSAMTESWGEDVSFYDGLREVTEIALEHDISFNQGASALNEEDVILFKEPLSKSSSFSVKKSVKRSGKVSPQKNTLFNYDITRRHALLFDRIKKQREKKMTEELRVQDKNRISRADISAFEARCFEVYVARPIVMEEKYFQKTYSPDSILAFLYMMTLYIVETSEISVLREVKPQSLLFYIFNSLHKYVGHVATILKADRYMLERRLQRVHQTVAKVIIPGFKPL